MINVAVNPDTEDELFAKEVAEVKAWWSDSRWRHTKRPFTAEQIVSKRGNLKIQYPGNAQSKKLWQIIENRFAVSLGAIARDSATHWATGTLSMRRTHHADHLTLTDQGCFLHLRLP